MVKVREDQPLLPDGRVDIERWVAGLEQSIALKDRSAMVAACRMAEDHALNAAKEYPLWRNIGESFSIGLEMADILAGLHLDQPALMAAVLYRCVRKGILPIEKVEEKFGHEVAGLIDGVQRMAAISQRQINEGLTQYNQQDNIRRMLVTLIDDVRVALIKIVERTAMLRQVRNDPEEKQQRLAREVFDIYAPLAHRLGVGQIKWELEDLAFRYLHTADYKAVARQLAEKRLDRTGYIDEVKKTLAELLREQGIQKFDIDGRAKHIYSIWRKMQRKKIDFSQVYDVRAVRVLVPRVSDCYTVLGVVHSRWHHIPHEFDDYIANPKPNGYQSLHTAVLGPQNKVLEIQIRTFAMHDDAELGVCAHWRYKGTDLNSRSSGYEQKIAWMRHVLEWQDEVGESSDFKTDLASDIAEDRVYVFTPDGHVIDLPRSATPIDFAYRVHTEIGHRCRGAKVNGRIVPLTYPLSTGQQVEILTSSQGGPSRDWLTSSLGYVRTSRARSKIQAWFKQQDRDQNVQEGRVLLEKEFHRLALEGLDLERLAEAVNYTTPDDMYAAIGAGDLRIGQVLSQAQQLFGDGDDDDEAQEKLDKLLTRSRHGGGKAAADQITVLGVGNLKTQMANCCHPVPGDQIAGFITHGRGITIHREDCPNILQLRLDDPNRVVQVEWGGQQTTTYSVDIEIIAWDRHNLLKDVINVLSNEKANVLGVNSRTNDENMARLVITLEVSGLELLSRVCSRVQQLSNVTDVRRLRQGGKHDG
ncbi:GTP diphosphokinase [Zymobacter sp. IVIA_5232.4 C2]|uniref:GTP diphosphokinase n=1 Tax=Zymobacter sp. IVIA_5232.4 C2 TaxID=3394855 RepID=UPI0039C26F65